MSPVPPLILHATTISIDGQGVLILGPSGAGKSALAIQLMALGAQLVSDDRTIVTKADGMLIASAPSAIAGLIEARGIGLIRTVAAGPMPLALVVDLSQEEPDRLPHPHSQTLFDVTLPCLWRVSAAHFAPSILLYLKGGIGEPA